jgi:hypothetical protein
MPPRPKHIPHNIERTTLQKMSHTRGLTFQRLQPAGKQTVAGMVAKGWIENNQTAVHIASRRQAMRL